MKLPRNIELPFFTYGLFKPGQLCFFRIKEFTEEISKGTIFGILKERDGIPLLIQQNYSKVKGFLIYFYSGKEDDAYKRIIEIEPEKVYKWGEAVANNNINANVLIGRRELRGSSDLEHCEEWDGKSDPYFRDGLEEVERFLEENQNFNLDYKTLFQLQMAYTLLWSCIERYASLRYHLGSNVAKKVQQIAKEDSFTDSLKRNVKNKRQLFSTTDLRKYVLDPDDPIKSIDYYYQVRSNAVHRGKAVVRDFETVKSSLRELLEIFKDILNKAFEEWK